MGTEERVIKASIMAGITDFLIAIIMYVTGGHAWYYERFHVFGVLGVGMLAYGLWHAYFYKQDTRNCLWKKKIY